MSRLPAPLPWPGGATSAASFSFDVDAESAVLWGAPAVAERMSVVTHQAYGPLVGVPRLLDLLERQWVRSTFFVPGYTAHRHPGVVRDIAAAGHELAHHGYLHEQPSALTAAQEAEALDRGLAERGFLYDSSLMDADAPYELRVDDGAAAGSSLVEVPIHWALDDWERYAYLPGITGSGLVEAPAVARAVWEAELEGARAAGGCWVLTGHPFLSGRPGRALELERLVERVVGLDDVWLAGLGEVAAHVRTLGLAPRLVERPVLEERDR